MRSLAAFLVGLFATMLMATNVYAATISGTVFEDVNYGGGAGRNLSATGAVGRTGARVELFNSSGTYSTFVTTGANGAYSFTGLTAGNYIVRVVNSTVSSSRTGYVSTLRAVQTYRTDAGSGAPVAVTNKVGGETPHLIDAGNGSTTLAALTTATTTAQSITAVSLSATDIAGVDFGFNFDTIVNTNNNGQGSLAQFVLNANALDNSTLDQAANALFKPAAGAETSIFMIPATDPNYNGGTPRITLTSVAPAGYMGLGIIGANTHLNAYTQAGAVPGPIASRVIKVELTTSNSLSAAFHLASTANDTVIAGFAIYGFRSANISVNAASRVHIQGNFVGTQADGASGPNTNVRDVQSTGTTDLVIGVKLDGVAAASNDGMTDADEGNVLGRSDTGVDDRDSTNTVVAGNYVGVDRTGYRNIGNRTYGVYISGTTSDNLNAQIGGTDPLQRNIIGFNKYGISITGQIRAVPLSVGTRVYGNYIGVGPDGSTSIGNTLDGILVFDSRGALIGNGNADGRNVISANTRYGILLVGYPGTFVSYAQTDDAIISGNYIGVAADGTTARGNGDSGISIAAASFGHRIVGNRIAFNTGNGVEVRGSFSSYSAYDTPINNTITKNSIYANTLLGIDLSADTPNGVTLDDANDADGGSNNLLNYPLFKSATVGNGKLIVQGCAPAGATIELFRADRSPFAAVTGPVNNMTGKLLNYGEGETFLADFVEGTNEDVQATPVDCSTLTDADGNSAVGMNPFKWTIAAPTGVVEGDVLTATATLTKNTSEFSPAVTVTLTPSTVQLRKTWVNATVTNAADVSGNGLTTLSSVADSANETDAGVIDTAYAGSVINLTESFTAGLAVYYTSSLACTGNTNALVGNALTIAGEETIVCTMTNTRKPTLKVQKITLGGFGGAFSFSQTNLVANPAVISTTQMSKATPDAPTAVAVSTTGQSVSLTEAPAAGYALTAASCTDANSALTGNTGSVGTLVGNTLTIPASATVSGADFNCVFTNSKLPQVRLQIALPDGRVVSTDQFTLSIAGGSALVPATTTGVGTAAVESASLTGQLNTTYSLTQAAAGTTALNAYRITYNCTNALPGGQTPSGTGTSFSVTLTAGDDLTCTFTDLPPTALTSVPTLSNWGLLLLSLLMVLPLVRRRLNG